MAFGSAPLRFYEQVFRTVTGQPVNDHIGTKDLHAGEDHLYAGTSCHVPDWNTVVKRSRDLLLIRAAEDALRSYLTSSGTDIARGALYVYPADCPLPKDAHICLHTGDFVFFR